MQPVTQHIIKSGKQYDHLFPQALFSEKTVKRNAKLEDTLAFIPEVIFKTNWQVEQFVNRELKHLSLEQACQRLWHFVKNHIAYNKDDWGTEQVRSPRRLWWDRQGDCDCYSVFIGAVLSLLDHPFKTVLRITKYKQNHFQHIYPVVILPNQQEIILDCVTHSYNYEEPYSEKKDFTMELNYLDGIDANTSFDELFSQEEEDLGRLFSKLKKKRAAKKAERKANPKEKGRFKKVMGKVLNVANKVNPGAALLRAGVLAAMKLNFMKAAQRLKYAYLTPTQAQQQGADMAKYQRLVAIKDKIEKVFYGAGGKPVNFKNAVLKGKGNKNQEVPLSGIGSFDTSVVYLNMNTPLSKVIGQDVYEDEFLSDPTVQGLGELGEPATGAALAAASGIIGTIVGLLKKLGNLFPQKKNADFDDAEVTPEDQAILEEGTATYETDVDLDAMTTDFEEKSLTTKSTTTADNSDSDDQEPSFWEKHKKWLKPTLWGTGIATALGIGYALLRPKEEEKKKPTKSLNGTPAKKTTKRKTTKRKATKRKTTQKKPSNRMKEVKLG